MIGFAYKLSCQYLFFQYKWKIPQVWSTLPALELLPLDCSRRRVNSRGGTTPFREKWIKFDLVNRNSHDADWLGLSLNWYVIIVLNTMIYYHGMYSYNKSLLQNNCELCITIARQGYSRDCEISFLSPRYLNTWSYKGLVLGGKLMNFSLNKIK